MKRIDGGAVLLFLASVYLYIQGYVCYTAKRGTFCVVCGFLCAFCLVWFFRRIFSWRYLRLSMKKVDKLSGSAFEKYARAQFRRLGYRVTLTEPSHDYGADLILKKRGEKIVVQTKRYEKSVGIAAVQEVVGSVAYYEADRAMVVTNSHFTKSARTLAQQNDVELWDRKEIRKQFKISE